MVTKRLLNGGPAKVKEYSAAIALLNHRGQKVVPTQHSPAPRDNGRYESRRKLPDLDLTLDQTLRDIAQCHESRERSKRSFETLWSKVCRNLGKQKNAFSYELWKRQRLVKNLSQFQEADNRLAEALAKLYTPPDGATAPYSQAQADIEEFEKLKKDRAALRPKSGISTDDMLEIAIAYWIEAKNARDLEDELRCLHALTKCTLHLGMALSPKTEAESRSEAGAKQGAAARTLLASIAVKVLAELQVNKSMSDRYVLAGSVIAIIERDPTYREAIEIYERQAVSGKRVKHGRTDRLTETLLKWVEKKECADLSRAFAEAMVRATELGRARPKPALGRCQAHS